MSKRRKEKAPQPPAPAKSDRRIYIAMAILALATIVVYANGTNGAFIFDDMDSIVFSPSVRYLWPPGMWMAAGTSTTAAGRPVLQITLAINYALNGLHERGYHIVNILIHLLGGLTLFGILRRTLLLPKFGDRFKQEGVWVAMAIALLWLVHPLQTNAVTYIVQRAESLVGLWILLTLYCAIRAQTTDSALRRRDWIICSILCCALGVLTKEVAAVAPMLVLLYDWCFFEPKPGQRKWYVGLFATWFILAALMAGGYRANTAGFGFERTAWEYLRTQPSVILHYLLNIVRPILVLDYNWQPTTSWKVILIPGAVVVTLLGLTVWGIWRKAWWGFCGAWFFIILAPTSSFVPIADLAMDHRMYLPLAAVMTLIVVGAYLFASKNRTWRVPELAALVIAVVALGAVAMKRNSDFDDQVRMWSDTIRKSPLNVRAYYNLGVTYDQLGREALAEEYYRRALRMNPNYTFTQFRLGQLLYSQGKTKEAIAVYRDGLKRDTDFAPMYAKLGIALASVGNLEEAQQNVDYALKLLPKSPEGQMAKGHLEMIRGNLDGAIEHYQESVDLDPASAEGQNYLGLALTRTLQFPAAIEHLREAVTLRPGYAEAHHNLSVALVGSGDIQGAIKEAERAVEIRPNYLDVHLNLALIYASGQRADLAKEHLLKVIEIDPSNATARKMMERLGIALPASRPSTQP